MKSSSLSVLPNSYLSLVYNTLYEKSSYFLLMEKYLLYEKNKTPDY